MSWLSEFMVETMGIEPTTSGLQSPPGYQPDALTN